MREFGEFGKGCLTDQIRPVQARRGACHSVSGKRLPLVRSRDLRGYLGRRPTQNVDRTIPVPGHRVPVVRSEQGTRRAAEESRGRKGPRSGPLPPAPQGVAVSPTGSSAGRPGPGLRPWTDRNPGAPATDRRNPRRLRFIRPGVRAASARRSPRRPRLAPRSRSACLASPPGRSPIRRNCRASSGPACR